MTGDFFKYPPTPHLALLGDLAIRGDKVLSESERHDFLRHEVIVEEKIDGANLGISFDGEGNVHAQNRGKYLHLSSSGQWKKLAVWLTPKVDAFFGVLTDRYILFGEWCYAQHTVAYDRLPDWFLGFDIYDTSSALFLSCPHRDYLLRTLGIAQVPKIGSGKYTLRELTAMLSQSRLGSNQAEGLYLRLDKGDWLVQRAKLVHPEFMRSVRQHWSHSGLKPNRLETNAGGAFDRLAPPSPRRR